MLYPIAVFYKNCLITLQLLNYYAVSVWYFGSSMLERRYYQDLRYLDRKINDSTTVKKLDSFRKQPYILPISVPGGNEL